MPVAFMAVAIIALFPTASLPHPRVVHLKLGSDLTRAACEQVIKADMPHLRSLVARGRGKLTASCVPDRTPHRGAPRSDPLDEHLEVTTTPFGG